VLRKKINLQTRTALTEGRTDHFSYIFSCDFEMLPMTLTCKLDLERKREESKVVYFEQSVASVCPSVCPSVSTLPFEPTDLELELLCVGVKIIARLGLKVKVKGQCPARMGVVTQ